MFISLATWSFRKIIASLKKQTQLFPFCSNENSINLWNYTKI